MTGSYSVRVSLESALAEPSEIKKQGHLQLHRDSLQVIRGLERKIEGYELFWSWIRGVMSGGRGPLVLDAIRLELEKYEESHGLR